MDKNKAEWIRWAVTKYEGKLMRYAISLVGNIEKAREIVQETFFKLWKQNRSKIDDYLLPWLLRVCRNHAFDVLRKEKRMENISDEQLLEDKDAICQDEDLCKRERFDTVKQAMQGLQKKQQEILIIKFQNDLSYKEISEVTGYTVSNVGFIMHEAISNLREVLKS